MPKVFSQKQINSYIKKFDYIKVNIPDTHDNYVSGNGEGVFAVITTKRDKEKYDKDCASGTFVAVLCNDSVYYPNMKCGSTMVCEYRGDMRPVVCWNTLSDTDEAGKNRKKILKELGVS